MAGYDFGNWKSNNAIDAEGRGLMTIGRAAKRLGITVATLRDNAYPAERHHVSGAYNLVDYYSIASITDSQLSRMRKECGRFTPHSIIGANVKWLTWPKMKVGRFSRSGKTPQPTEHEATSVRVTFKTPATIMIHLESGDIMTKRVTTNGLHVTHNGETLINNE